MKLCQIERKTCKRGQKWPPLTSSLWLHASSRHETPCTTPDEGGDDRTEKVTLQFPGLVFLNGQPAPVPTDPAL
jgi:hypothetical protein